jgi:hypothetical protein
MRTYEKKYGFTQINWEDVIVLQRVVKKSAEINQVKKLTYADLLIISIIKGYGRDGYFGTHKKIGDLIDMPANQVCKHINKLKKIKSIYNQQGIFYEENNALVFNLRFLVEYYEIPVSDDPFTY